LGDGIRFELDAENGYIKSIREVPELSPSASLPELGMHFEMDARNGYIKAIREASELPPSASLPKLGMHIGTQLHESGLYFADRGRVHFLMYGRPWKIGEAFLMSYSPADGLVPEGINIFDPSSWRALQNAFRYEIVGADGRISWWYENGDPNRGRMVVQLNPSSNVPHSLTPELKALLWDPIASRP